MANDFSGDSNCVAVYRFESGALTADAKGSNTLTNNGASESTGDFKEGSCCVDLDSTDYLSIADANLDSGFPWKNGSSGNEITLCAWIKPLTSQNHHPIWNKHEDAKYSIGLSASYATFRFYYSTSGSGLVYVTFTTTFTVNRWLHVGLTVDSDNSYRIRVWDDTAGDFLDSDATGTLGGTPYVSDAVVTIGEFVGYYGDCLLDELVVFKDVKTPGQIDAIRGGTYVVGDGVAAQAMHLRRQMEGL